MKIYLAGDYYEGALSHHPCCLISYFKGKIMQSQKTFDIFLDSGAFSAYSKGAKIDIQEYCDFIKQNKKLITVYSNLDVIGNSKATWNNQRYMEKQGLYPIPVFHYNEDIKWLKRYLSRKYSYIALGGMVPISTKYLKKWLDQLWTEYLTDNEGFPVTKIHGFGLTTLPLLLRYPWYSVDSTSWVLNAAMGSVFVPKKNKGKWDYSKSPINVLVSLKQDKDKEHINNLSQNKKELVYQYLKENNIPIGRHKIKKVKTDYKLRENQKWFDKENSTIIKIKEEGITNSALQRQIANCLYFKNLQESLPQYPWKFKISKTMRLF